MVLSTTRVWHEICTRRIILCGFLPFLSWALSWAPASWGKHSQTLTRMMIDMWIGLLQGRGLVQNGLMVEHTLNQFLLKLFLYHTTSQLNFLNHFLGELRTLTVRMLSDPLPGSFTSWGFPASNPEGSQDLPVFLLYLHQKNVSPRFTHLQNTVCSWTSTGKGKLFFLEIGTDSWTEMWKEATCVCVLACTPF